MVIDQTPPLLAYNPLNSFSATVESKTVTPARPAVSPTNTLAPFTPAPSSWVKSNTPIFLRVQPLGSPTTEPARPYPFYLSPPTPLSLTANPFLSTRLTSNHTLVLMLLMLTFKYRSAGRY